MNNEIKRATGLLVIETVGSNPNGDPDNEGEPRQRIDGKGEISPVSFKRKLRDLLEDSDTPFFRSLPEKFSLNPDSYRILEHRGRDREAIYKEQEMGQEIVEIEVKDKATGKLLRDVLKTLREVEIEVKDKATGKNKKENKVLAFNQEKFLNSDFVRKYWDARLFGNTFLYTGVNKGFIKTGVVQFGLGVSIAPINVIRHTNTSKAGVESDKDSGTAPLNFRVVEHGVYLMPFFINANFASKTGCTQNDIDLLKLLIPHAYDLTRSAIRPDVRIKHAWYIEHTNVLGSCPDHILIEALSPKLTSDISTSWADYEDVDRLPMELAERVASVEDLVQSK